MNIHAGYQTKTVAAKQTFLNVYDPNDKMLLIPLAHNRSYRAALLCVAYFLVAKPWNHSGKFPLFWMSGSCVSVNHLITSSFRPPSSDSICRSTANCFSILTGFSGADREAVTHTAYSQFWWRLTLKRKTSFLIWLFLLGDCLIWIVVLFQFYLPVSLLPLTGLAVSFYYLWSKSQIEL